MNNYIKFLESINQKLKSFMETNKFDIETNKFDIQTFTRAFNPNEILELRKHEKIMDSYNKIGFIFTFDDYISFRKYWQDFNYNVARDRKEHDNNQNYFKKFYNKG